MVMLPHGGRTKGQSNLQRISLPNGKIDPMAILKCCMPQGIPTMVTQQISPHTRWIMAISHHPRSIQIRFITTDMHPGSPGPSTRSWPKGHRA